MNIFSGLQRLRSKVANTQTIDQSGLKIAGVQEAMHLPDYKLHLLIGLDADRYATEMKEQLAKT